MIKDGNVYVPVDFLKSSIGLKLDVKDNKVTFNTNTNKVVTPKPETKPQKKQHGYTGSQVEAKVRGLDGFFRKNQGYAINKYGKTGATQCDYVHFNVLSGQYDMNVTIIASNPEIDSKLKKYLIGYFLLKVVHYTAY